MFYKVKYSTDVQYNIFIYFEDKKSHVPHSANWSLAKEPNSPPQTWLNPESKQESDWKVTFFERPYTLCFSSDKDAKGMKNVLRVPNFSKIIFSERSDTWFAPPGTPKAQKILPVWLFLKKHTKNGSFFELSDGHPRCYQHIIWILGAS